MSYRNLIVLFGILFVFHISPLQANTTWNANSMWIERSGEKSLSLEMAIPDFKTPLDWDLSGQIFQLSFDNRLNDQVKLLFEVPFVNAKAEARYYSQSDSESETLLGNPYIGFDISSVNPQLSTEVGIRIPLGSDDKEFASAMGLLGDMERMDAYIQDCLPISARFKYQSNQVDPVTFRLQGGPMIIFNADEYFVEDNTEIFLNYGGFIGVKSANTSIMAGMTGLMLVSENGLDFDERTTHFAGVTLGINMKSAQLGLYYKVPIDDELEDALDDVIGLYLTMNL